MSDILAKFLRDNATLADRYVSRTVHVNSAPPNVAYEANSYRNTTVTTTRRRIAICFCALLVSNVYADTPRSLIWADLVPRTAPADNPFAKFTKAQLLALNDIAEVRDRRARGVNISQIEQGDEEAATRKLEREGVDVDGLMARRKELGEQKRARAYAVNSALDGQVVRMPGYLLPLEFAGKQVTEFLLVPWVGACVHTPPPPPNQIVYVKADKPFDFHGMFTPIQITGQMMATATKKALYLIDGSSDINIGYSMRATLVEPYKE